MRIGIILTGYNMEEYVIPCLTPWIKARKERLGGHEFVICAVSLPFAGFPNDTEDDTTEKLIAHMVNLDIDYVISEPRNVPETTARGMALRYLKGRECDILWQVDLDEFYEIDQIDNILKWVENNPFVAWFRLSLKNFVIDNKTYLAEPFQPPRIHRLDLHGYTAHSFGADNDIHYGGKITRDIIPQERFPCQTIPPECAWIRHESWPNSLRSKKKIEYQLEGRKWPQCQFSWDDSQGGLIFNPTLPRPKVITEST